MKKIAATIVGTIVIVIACVLYLSTNVEGYTDISPYDLEKIVDKEEKVYVYFYSENCVTCRKIKSNLKELKKEDSSLKVYGVNVDEYRDSSFIEEYSGYKVPKVVEFIEGSKYKELEDKSIDALREFIVVNNAQKNYEQSKVVLTGASSDTVLGNENKSISQKKNQITIS